MAMALTEQDYNAINVEGVDLEDAKRAAELLDKMP
jgi:hypothetical protein